MNHEAQLIFIHILKYKQTHKNMYLQKLRKLI